MNPAVVIGECMIELSLTGERQAVIGYAGDTFNTAVYLQRLGVPTRYATALGRDDPFSKAIVRLMADEGVSDGLVARVEGRLPGLYAIETDHSGERRFHYWRDNAPARQLMDFTDPSVLETAMSEASLVYVSAITLAIVGEGGRFRLIEALRASGSTIALDTNYRARLWPSPESARAAVEALTPICRFISMSAADVSGFGANPVEASKGWARGGAEVLVRRDDHSIEVLAGDRREAFAPPEPVAVIDTTGAGDSFNAGYLAARLQGRSIAEAVVHARRLAAAVVGHRGAIIPKSSMPL
jgi:2-dehydro-3-deoxygluconokinase